jgi:hypothetical protein
MTAETGLLACILQAEGHVRNARRYWDPANLFSCEQCAEQLQQAIELMTAAQQAAARGAAAIGARTRLTQLRGEVEVLSRLIDSAMAFSRGLALRMASQEPVHSELKG